MVKEKYSSYKGAQIEKLFRMKNKNKRGCGHGKGKNIITGQGRGTSTSQDRTRSSCKCGGIGCVQGLGLLAGECQSVGGVMHEKGNVDAMTFENIYHPFKAATQMQHVPQRGI